MSAINYFESLVDYTNHVKSTDNSEMSLVTQKDLHYDGLNVENKHKIPAIGDCLYLDSNNQRHFFYGATVKNDILISRGYTPVGVVAHKYDNKIILVHKNESEQRFCSTCIQKLSNFKIDGTANNIKVRYYTSSDAKTIIADTFTESCSSLQDFVTKFDTFLRANQVSSYDWHCELLNVNGNDAACVVIDKYTATYKSTSVIESGAAATMINWTLVGEGVSTTYLTRNNGATNSLRACVNVKQLINYMSTHDTIDGSDSIKNGSGVINQSDFNNNVYPTVKSYYGTYENYIESILMRTKPLLKGGQITLQDGETICNKMKSITCPNLSGETTYVFSACKWATDLTTGGLNWRLPDINEAFDIFSKVNIDGSDAMNIGLYNMTGKQMLFNVVRNTTAERGRDSIYALSNIGLYALSNVMYSITTTAISVLQL